MYPARRSAALAGRALVALRHLLQADRGHLIRPAGLTEGDHAGLDHLDHGLARGFVVVPRIELVRVFGQDLADGGVLTL